MKFLQNTGRTIQKAFNEFHKNNPLVYTHFKKMALEAINKKNKKKLSSKMIINVIRWEIYMETIELTLFTDVDGSLKKFKINDAYTSRYARLFTDEYPQHCNIFNMRELRSA